MLFSRAQIFRSSLCCLVLSLASPLVAQIVSKDPDQPVQELMETEVVYPQEKHELQLTSTTRLEKSSTGMMTFSSPVTIEFGLSDSWQVGIEWGFAQSQNGDLPGHTTRGLGDMELDTKYSFMKIRGSRYHAALSFRLGLPTGNVEQGLGEGKLELEPTLICARDLPRFHGAQVFTQVGLNIPFAIHSSGEPVSKQAIWNIGAFVPYKQVRMILEATTQADTHNGMSVQLTPGLVVKAPGGFEIGMGFYQPIGVQDRKQHFVLKITHEFGGGKEL